MYNEVGATESPNKMLGGTNEAQQAIVSLVAGANACPRAVERPTRTDRPDTQWHVCRAPNGGRIQTLDQRDKILQASGIACIQDSLSAAVRSKDSAARTVSEQVWWWPQRRSGEQHVPIQITPFYHDLMTIPS